MAIILFHVSSTFLALHLKFGRTNVELGEYYPGIILKCKYEGNVVFRFHTKKKWYGLLIFRSSFIYMSLGRQKMAIIYPETLLLCY